MSITKLSDFVVMIKKLLHSDRDVNIAIGGMTGEGKSSMAIQLMKEYYKQDNKKYNLENMTWDRDELMKWIDGEPGTRAGQLDEYSGIIVDEAFLLFYRRTWYEEGQQNAISVLNTCRNRHLFLCCNVPTFWSLDSHMQQRMRFFIFIPQRGVAWIFQQDKNPFTEDPWNVKENKKVFAKKKNPYSCPNFVCEIHYPDLEDKEKEKYLKLRNTKRVDAMQNHKTQKSARVKDVLKRRDILIRLLVNQHGYTQKSIAEILNMDESTINLVINNPSVEY